MLEPPSPYEEGHAPPSPPVAPDWYVGVSDSVMGYALSDPIPYLVIDFGIALVIGILVANFVIGILHISIVLDALILDSFWN